MTTISRNINSVMTMRAHPCENCPPRHRKNVPVTRSRSDGLNLCSASSIINATSTPLSSEKTRNSPENDNCRKVCKRKECESTPAKRKDCRIMVNVESNPKRKNVTQEDLNTKDSLDGMEYRPISVSPVSTLYAGSMSSGRPRAFTAQAQLNGNAHVHEEDGEHEPDYSTGGSSRSSCQAIKCAVSALSRLDDFVCETLGAGFFSEVYKVTHRTTGQVMVLKMNTSLSNRPNMLREVQLMNRMSHPNILKFMGVCVHEGQLHALTEFINGGSLEQLLASDGVELPWTTRINVGQDLARGMCYLHSKGVFHRDLTSKNVLIRVEETKEEEKTYIAVVGDFGLAAKIPDPLDKDRRLSIVGSPYWMAPEVLKGEWYNEKADVFSSGIIMCEMTARIEADPDVLPRTANFGVDYVAFSEMVEYCPLEFLQLAFRCCQIDYKKRPSFREIADCLETINHNLNEEAHVPQQAEMNINNSNSGKLPSKKRSRSEDNILQANDYLDVPTEEAPLTPQVIGQTMSENDPFYSPTKTNPFASSKRYKDGRKILGVPRDPYSLGFLDLELSPASPYTPPCTPIADGGLSYTSPHRRNCHSLPASPVLLRKAAEKLHQESLHGSNPRGSISFTGRPVHSPGILKSKSDILGERTVQRLDFSQDSLGEQFTYPISVHINDRPLDNSTLNTTEVMKSTVSTTTTSMLTVSKKRSAFQKKQYSVDCAIMYEPDRGSYWDMDDTVHSTKNRDLIVEEMSHISMETYSSPAITETASTSSSAESFMSLDDHSSVCSWGDGGSMEVWHREMGIEKLPTT